MGAVKKEQISEVIDPVITGAGYELVDLEWRREGKAWVLRLFIDKGPASAKPSEPVDKGPTAPPSAKPSEPPVAQEAAANGNGGADAPATAAPIERIGLDDCTKVSREVSATLDVHDVIQVPFTLEVSSPGLDRPLRTAEHFRRHAEQRARVQLKTGLEGRRNFTGKILGVSEDNLVIRFETDDGKQFDLPVADLEKANLKYEI